MRRCRPMDDPDRYRDLLVERLRALIEERDMSVMRVEKRIGRGRGYVADALRGHKKLTIEVILDVLAVLGVSPQELFGHPVPRRGDESAKTPVVDASRTMNPPVPRLRGRSPLVQAVLLLLAQKGVRQDELREIERAIADRLGRVDRPTPRRSQAARR